jgi:hypothetical protein
MKVILEVTLGNVIDFTASFIHNGAPVTPDSASFFVRSPSGDEFALDSTLVGDNWTASFEPEEAGTWTIRAEGGEPYQSAAERDFRVVNTVFATLPSLEAGG